MATHLKVMAVTFAMLCVLGVYDADQVRAEQLTIPIQTECFGGSVALQGFLVDFLGRNNIPLDLDFTIDGNISIEGTSFNQDFSSSKGEVTQGPWTVSLDPGTYTLTETYSGEASASSVLLAGVLTKVGLNPIDLPEQTFTRTISVVGDTPRTYTIEAKATVRALTIDISGGLVGSHTVDGTVGSSISVDVGLGAGVVADKPAEISACIGATLVSDTTILVENKPPQVTVDIQVENPGRSGEALVSSTLIASATATDPEDGDLTSSYQWLKNDQPIEGATGTTLSGGQFAKKDQITVRATATDSGGKSGSASRQITIQNSPPSPPTITIETSISEILAGSPVPFEIIPGGDPDGDPVSIVSISAELSSGSGWPNRTVTATITSTKEDGTKVGNMSFHFLKANVIALKGVANDGEVDIEFGIQIAIVNEPPHFEASSLGEAVKENTEFVKQIPVYDTDALTLTTEITKTTAEVPADRPEPTIEDLRVDKREHDLARGFYDYDLKGTPRDVPPGGATFSIRVDADDGDGGSVSRTFDLVVENVNKLPVLTIDPPAPEIRLPLDGTSVPLNVSISATDEDGEAVSLHAISIDQSVGDVIKAFNGDDTPDVKTLTFDLSVADLEIDADGELIGRLISLELVGDDDVPGGVTKVPLSISLSTGEPLNFPPQLRIPNQTLIQTNQADMDRFEADFAVHVFDQDLPQDAQFTFSAVSDLHGASLDASGIFRWEYPEVKPGTYVITVEVKDTPALPDLQKPQSAEQSITFTIVNPNDPPTIQVIESETVSEGNSLEFVVTGTDPDPGDVIAFSAGSLPIWLTFDPDLAAFSGTVPFDISRGDDVTMEVISTVTDREGASASAATVITVQNTNRPPEFQPIGGTVTAQENQILQFSVSAVDPDKEVLKYELVEGAGALDPNTGVYALDLTGNFDAAQEYNGVVSVRFQVADPFAETDTIDVPITIVNVNRPPQMDAIGDQEIREGHPSDIVMNATDPDLQEGASLPASNFSATAIPPLPFTPEFLEGRVMLRLDPGYDAFGRYDVTVSVKDDEGATASQSFSLTVANTNRAAEGTPPDLEAFLGGRLLKDLRREFTDPDNDPLTFALTTGPDGLTISPGGLLDWTVPQDFALPQVSVEGSVVDQPEAGDPIEVPFSLSIAITAKELLTNKPPEFLGSPSLEVQPEGLALIVPSVSDPDNPDDEPLFLIQWSKDGVGMPEFDDARLVPRTAIKPDELWSVVVTAADILGSASEPATASTTIPDMSATLTPTLSGGSNSRDPVTILVNYKDPDLTPSVDTVNLHVEIDGSLLVEEVLTNENSADSLVGSYRFSGLFVPGDYTYTVNAEGANDASGSFSISNTPPEVHLTELDGIVTGSVPINYALTDIDDQSLEVRVLLDGNRIATISGDNPGTLQANQVVEVNWDSEADLPDAAATRGEGPPEADGYRTSHKLTILVSDGEESAEASTTVRVFSGDAVPTPTLGSLPGIIPAVRWVEGDKGIVARTSLAEFGVELSVNGQSAGELPPTSDGGFLFENVQLADGENRLQANLFTTIRYTGNVIVPGDREPLPNTIGRTRYRYTYGTEFRTFESHYAGSLSEEVVTNADAVPPVIVIASPGEVALTRTPMLLASVRDRNLNKSTIVFELDGRQITPDFSRGLARYIPPTTSPLAPGAHHLKVTAKDYLRNLGSSEMDFTINLTEPDRTPPTVASLSPDDGDVVLANPTEVVVRVSDAQSDLDPGSVVTKINDVEVEHTYSAIDPRTGQISFTTTEVNEDRVIHVEVSIADKATNPNTLIHAWSFEVNAVGPIVTFDPFPLRTKEKVITITGVTEPGARVAFRWKNLGNGVSPDPNTGAFSYEKWLSNSNDGTVTEWDRRWGYVIEHVMNVFAIDKHGKAGPTTEVRIIYDGMSPIVQYVGWSPLEYLVTDSAQVDQVKAYVFYGHPRRGDDIWTQKEVPAIYDKTTGLLSLSALTLEDVGIRRFGGYYTRIGSERLLYTFQSRVHESYPGEPLSASMMHITGVSFIPLTIHATDTLGNLTTFELEHSINQIETGTDYMPPRINNVSVAGQDTWLGPGDSWDAKRVHHVVKTNGPPVISALVTDRSGVKSVRLTGSQLEKQQVTRQDPYRWWVTSSETIYVDVGDGFGVEMDYDPDTRIARGQPGSDLPDGLYRANFIATDNVGKATVGRSDNQLFFEVKTSIEPPVITTNRRYVTSYSVGIGVSSGVYGSRGSFAGWFVNGELKRSGAFRDSGTSLNLELGLNEIYLEVTDDFGNEATSNVLTVIRDNTSPEIYLVNPVNDSTVSGKAPITVELIFRDPQSGIREDSIAGRIESPSGVRIPIPIPSPSEDGLAANQENEATEVVRTIPISDPEEGAYRVTAFVTNNTGRPTRFTASFTVDNTPPEIEILVPAEGEVTPNRLPQLSGYINLDDVKVESISATLNGTPIAPRYSLSSGQVIVPLDSQLKNGDYTLTISATDPAGNPNSASRSFTIDTTAPDKADPTLSGFFPSDGATINNPSLALLSFIAADAGGVDPSFIVLTVNNNTYQLGQESGAILFDRGRFTILLNRLMAPQPGADPFQLDHSELNQLEDNLGSPVGIGLNTVSVQVSDEAGNISVAEWSFTVVTEPPAVPILDALAPTTNETEISVSGQVPDAPSGTTVAIYANDVRVRDVPVQADGTFAAEALFLLEGANRIAALATDVAGNQSGRSDAQTIFLDVEPPQIIISDLPETVGNASVTVAGTVVDDSGKLGSISIVVNEGAAQDTGIDADFSVEIVLQPGENTILVEAVDTVGNPGSETLTVTLDSDAPITAPPILIGRVNPTGDGIQLTWQTDENASVYNVYRSNSEITEIDDLQPVAARIPDSEFTDVAALAGHTYHYAVTSVDSAGNEGTVVSDSPNITLIARNGGTAAIPGTELTFGVDGIFNPIGGEALTASVTIDTVSDATSTLPDLPDAIADSIRAIVVTDQFGIALEQFNTSAVLNLAYPESITDSADFPRMVAWLNETWVELENQVMDTENNTVSAPITQSGLYRLIGESRAAPWDTNADGTVDILDLVIVGGQFGATPPTNPAADPNGDGTVDILDLVMVGGHFGESSGTSAAPVIMSQGPAIGINMVAQKTDGNLITIEVQGDISKPLGGFQFDVGLDTKLLSLVKATEGDLLASQGCRTHWLSPRVIGGKMRLASVVLGSPAPEQEVGTRTSDPSNPHVSLAQISFSVKGDVEEALQSVRLGNILIADPEGRRIRVNLRNEVDTSSLETRGFSNALLQNYPNPFNPETWIPYSLEKEAAVVIRIRNALGQVVRELQLGRKEPGEYIGRNHAAHWDGYNNQGEAVASGIYFYTMTASDFTTTRKMVILK